MGDTAAGSIIVGVTGRGHETAALRYAARLAGREDREVVLVHAYPVDVVPPPPSSFTVSVWFGEVAERIAREVAEEFGELAPAGVRCRTEVRAGNPALVLTELSRGARAVVLQHRRSSLIGRVFVGSTAARVAGHAGCPVVSVPTDWNAPAEAGEIVVGVHGEGGPAEALHAGLAEARATGARVRVVHGWQLDAVYDDIITARVTEEWGVGRQQRAASTVGEATADFPDVEVSIEVVHQRPAQALLEQSAGADLLVVGRHARHAWLPERLGSVARTVLRESVAPVMVVPVGREQPIEDWGFVEDEVSPQS